MAWKRLFIGLALAGLIAAAAIVAALHAIRSAGPSLEEAQALRALALPDGQGGNAFDALWLLEYPVPEHERAAIVAEDARREQAWLDALHAGEVELVETIRRTSASGRHPRQVPDDAEREMFCLSGSDVSCLGHVRARPEAVERVLARHAPLLDRIEALWRYSHLRNGFPADGLVTLPPYQHVYLARTRDAHRFVSGETTLAMDGLCRRAAALRRLGADSDHIIFHLIAMRSATDFDARLFAEMLAELPAGAPVPAVCDAAFAPMSVEEAQGFCRTSQGEFAMLAGTLRNSHAIDAAAHSPLLRLADWFLYDPEQTIARSAMRWQAACAPAVAQAILEDRRLQEAATSSAPGSTQCLTNHLGCVLADIAGGPHYEYASRLQDSRARVALLRAVLALRQAREAGTAPVSADTTAQSEGPPGSGRISAAQFARAAADLEAEGRNLRLSDDGKRVRIDLFGGGDADAQGWEIPLPPVLWPDAVAHGRVAGR